MFDDLVIQPVTQHQLERFRSAPSHALLLTGPSGSGKWSLGRRLAAALLEVSADALDAHPYVRVIAPAESGKAISIEAVRELEHFLSLKVPGEAAVNRIVIVSEAEQLGIEAQNALLKTLEEPPVGTVLILLAIRAEALLPTIRSRATIITVRRPSKEATAKHFANKGISTRQIEQAYSISGGLPGLMTALLENNEHPLMPAVERARTLLSQSSYERLTTVDELSKQKTVTLDTLLILQQMAHVKLQSVGPADAERWQKILESSYHAHYQLSRNGQAKLVLTQLMLNIA